MMQPPAGASHVVAAVAAASDTDWLAPKTSFANVDAEGDGVGLTDGEPDTVAGADCDGDALAPYDTLGDEEGDVDGSGTQATRATKPAAPAPLAPPRKTTGPSDETML